MKVILDTNVLVSGIFFAGPPYEILKALRTSKATLVISPEILEEYDRVTQVLAKKYPDIDITPILQLLIAHAELKRAPALPEPVCEDSDDDKFIACALASKAKCIITGDKKLLAVPRYSNIRVVSPRVFVNEYLS